MQVVWIRLYTRDDRQLEGKDGIARQDFQRYYPRKFCIIIILNKYTMSSSVEKL